MGQTIGPFIGALLSNYSIVTSMYSFVDIIIFRWFSIGCYCISIVLVIFILEECQPRIIEQQQIVKNLKSQNLSPAEFQEQKKRLFKQLSLQSTVSNPK